MSMKQTDTVVVAVCPVTGAQGKEIVKRVARLNANNNDQRKIQIRGLTRDATTEKARELTEQFPSSLLSLFQVDYTSKKSLRNALKGATSLYLNCSIAMTQDANLYQRILDCAIQVGVQYIVYASILQVQDADKACNPPPHWTSARHAEGYLAIRQDETKMAFRYHVLRVAPHLNHTLLTKYQPGQNKTSDNVSWIAYPWQPSIRIPTVSAKDVARVACKLLLSTSISSSSLPDGAAITVATDHCSPHELAQYITLATNTCVQAHKGPRLSAILPSALTSFENQCLMAMGEYLEQQQETRPFGLTKRDWDKKQAKNKYKMEDLLKEEIKEEPLETAQAFVQRAFGGGTGLEDE